MAVSANEHTEVTRSSSIGPRNVTERNHKQVEFTILGTNVAKKKHRLHLSRGVDDLIRAPFKVADLSSETLHVIGRMSAFWSACAKDFPKQSRVAMIDTGIDTPEPSSCDGHETCHKSDHVRHSLCF